MTEPYRRLGIVLVIGGLFIILLSYSLISFVPLTATGLSIAIIGSTSLGLANATSRISPKTKDITLRTHNVLLISLAATFMIIDSLLWFFDQEDLAVYFVVNSIVYFITVSFYIALNPNHRLRNALTAVGVTIFIVFLVMIAFKIVNILK